jgi:DNA adenine methylase
MAYKLTRMAFFCYPGGKTRVNSHIVKILDSFDCNQDTEYREPFFGGGSVGLNYLFVNEKNIENIWINDKDSNLCSVWEAVIKYPDDFKKKVWEFTPTVDNFFNDKHILKINSIVPQDKDHLLDIAVKKVAIHQTSFSGMGTMSRGPYGGKEQKGKHKISEKWSPKYICKKIDLLHEHFKNKKIRFGTCSNLDFQDVIDDTKMPAIIYLDPPYYVKGNELYQCGFTFNDHVRLSNCLKNTKHNWLLSYDSCPEILNLYKDWAAIDQFTMDYYLTFGQKDSDVNYARKNTELLIYPRKM